MLLLLLFTTGLLYVLLRSSPVQTWLAGIATDYLSEELGTKVSISGVDIEFFKTGVFEDVYIEDRQGDTLIYVHRLKVDYQNFDNIRHHIDLNKVVLEDSKVLFGRHLNDTTGNFEFLIDYFNGGPRDPNKPKVIWTIHSRDVSLLNSRFDWFVEGEKPFDYMKFDYNRLSFYNINADFDDFYLVDDSLHFMTRSFSCRERCGIAITNMAAETKIHQGGIELHDLSLETRNGTVLKDDIVLETKDWSDYSDFVNKVYMRAHLTGSRVMIPDIAYFTNSLLGHDEEIRLEGDMNGLVSRLKGRNLKAGLMDRSVLEGDWSINGLPDIDNTFIDFNIRLLETDYEDIRKLTHIDDLPPNIKSLGLMRYKGRFTGFYNDFVAYGDFNSALGHVNADINLKFREGVANATYSGHLITEKFHLSRFYPEVPINTIAFDMNVKGKGMKTDNYTMDLEGSIRSAEMFGYVYQNIKAQGAFSPKLFSGEATVRDPNLELDFKGTVDLSGAKPVADFTAKVMHSDLKALKLDTMPHTVSGIFVLNFTGDNIDDAVGSIKADSLVINRNQKVVRLNHVLVTSSKSASNEILSLRSDLLDADVEGNYTLSKLPASVQDLMATLLPGYFEPPKEILPDENIRFSVNIKNPAVITELYLPQLSLKPGKVEGYYQSVTRSLMLDIRNEEIAWEGYKVKNLSLHAEKKSDSLLNARIAVSEFETDSFRLQNIRIASVVSQDKVDFDLSLQDTLQNLDVATAGSLTMNNQQMLLTMNKADVGFEGGLWQLMKPGSIEISDARYVFRDLLFRNSFNNQSLDINGAYTQDPGDKLNVDVKDFDLSIINKFTGYANGGIPKIYGKANGNVYLTTTQGHLLIGSDLKVEKLTLGTDTIGDLQVSSKSVNNTVQQVSARVVNGAFEGFEISGTINLVARKDNLDLKIYVPESDIRVAGQFLKGFVSNLRGRFAVDMTLKGSLNKPMLRGKVDLKNVSLIVDYLRASLNFTTSVHVEPNAFVIKDFELFDEQGGKAYSGGSITHRNFTNFYLDFAVKNMNNFHVLHTRSRNNELFYGDAYINGSTIIKGPFDGLNISIDAKTRKNTHMFIPISEGDQGGFPEYVHFKTGVKRIKRTEGIENINSLEMEIEATPDATIEIVFDEAMGDKIVGAGSGNIRMGVTRSGEFYMSGTYTVERGSYLFTFLNIYNKPFTIKRGGTITWYGDPTEARLNITAVNTVFVSPAPLLAGLQTYGPGIGDTRTEVQSELYLKGSLFRPDITFGIQFPNIENLSGSQASQLSGVIQRIKSDKEETNRQVFSMLIFGQLLTPTFTQQAATGAGASDAGNTGASDLVSNQLSNFLNRIDPNWRININYKGSNVPTLNPNWMVTISRRFLNDRLTIDGGYNNYSTGAPDINVEYKITQEGNLRVKAYNRAGTTAINTTSINAPVNTMGVGVVYQKEFNRFRLKKKKRKQ